MEQVSKNNCYKFKIITIILLFILGEILIWFIFVRHESFVWFNKKFNHSTSPYAISKIDDGRVIVSHVIKGFEYILPIGFEAKEEPVLSLNYMEGGQIICQVISQIVEDDAGVGGLQKKDSNFQNINLNGTNVMESLPTAENDAYRLAVGDTNYYIEYSLNADENNQTRCRYFLKQIAKSFRKY